MMWQGMRTVTRIGGCAAWREGGALAAALAAELVLYGYIASGSPSMPPATT